jgi:hypothetical protein
MSWSTRNAGKPWSPADDRKLADLARRNTPTGVIGFELGRTPDAIYSRASERNVSLKPTNRSPYGPRRK